MDRNGCRRVAGGGLWGGDLLRFQTLPSTNQWALDHGEDLRHGDVILAVRQTAGRGRFTRKWHSPGNRCLTFSFLIVPAVYSLLDRSR